MITFNMRERGPYEYDKYVLNTLQLYNAVTLSEMHELKEHADEKNSLLKLNEEVNKRYEDITCENGIADKIYSRIIVLKNGGIIK